MIIPDRTLDRRIADGANLKLEEADGIARLLRVVGMARRVFGDAALADEWLRLANPALDGHIPIRMARTDLGGREVEAVLGRIAHGVFGQVRVWRLTKAEHAPGLDGEGARLWGGLWNSPGVPMDYAASSLALAVIEVLVHLPPQMRRGGGFPPCVAVELDLPDAPAPPAPQPTLPPLEATRRIGDDRCRARSSLALWVPGIVIPQDRNLLINPAHPDIAKVRVAGIDAFRFDDRLGT